MIDLNRIDADDVVRAIQARTGSDVSGERIEFVEADANRILCWLNIESAAFEIRLNRLDHGWGIDVTEHPPGRG